MRGNSVGRVVGFGLICAVLAGAVVWLVVGSALWGLAIGLAAGACLAIVMDRFWGSPAFEGLSFDERRRVVRALRRGEPMREPRLAPALVQHGKRMLDKQLMPRQARIGLTVMFLLGAALAILGIAVGGWRDWATWDNWLRWPSGLMLMVFSLFMLLVTVPQSVRQRGRVARSVAETEKIPANQAARGD